MYWRRVIEPAAEGRVTPGLFRVLKYLTEFEMSTESEAVFKPRNVAARDKAAHTSAVAKGIVDAERAAREKKTARLRQQRLEAEAEMPEQPAKKASAAKKAPAAKKAKTKPARAKAAKKA